MKYYLYAQDLEDCGCGSIGSGEALIDLEAQDLNEAKIKARIELIGDCADGKIGDGIAWNNRDDGSRLRTAAILVVSERIELDHNLIVQCAIRDGDAAKRRDHEKAERAEYNRLRAKFGG